MNDAEIIQAGYQATLRQLYAALYESNTIAASDADRRTAEQRFAAGVTLARQVRDRALALL